MMCFGKLLDDSQRGSKDNEDTGIGEGCKYIVNCME